jgi:hypothetical protein
MNRALTLLVCCLAAFGSSGALADGKVTSPKEQFGWNIGDDYRLANYTQFQAYWKKLDQESDRMKVESIGKTAEGRDQLMAIITSPANHAKLARYKEIAQKLARAEGLSEQQARALAQEGKAVVWFDGGLHATEVLGAHQLMETTYQLLSKNDPETLRILNDVVILAVHANPDGMELVSNWYMREPDEKKRVSSDIPRLYQKYIGHDNNRDFYMNNQPESRNMSRILFQEWHPQIMYNHHQTGPTGAVLFAPPFRDPFNYNFDPGIPVGLDLVGAAMHGRFVSEGKPGATMRRGANYSTWWNGGLRTTVYFHNQIGLLTETIGNPTPIEIEFVPQRNLPNGDTPFPITPQKWHFRQSIDYSVTANYAVFDVASRHREQFLYNIYKMGRNSIERGSKDSWTVTPKWIDAVRAAAEKDQRAPSGSPEFNPAAAPGGLFAAARGGRSPVVPAKYFEMLRDPKKRDARGYILPASQPDFPTATKFINALQRSGIDVHRATREFTVAGKSYPAGSYVVKSAQAFRPHVLDMFEPQDHPNDFASPGGPPIPPYDNAGWTLAYQMGVEFDRILDGFDGPFEKLTELAKPPAATVASAGNAQGFLIAPRTNDSFLVANRLMKAGEEVWRMKSGPDAGAFYVAATPKARDILQRSAAELGVGATGTTRPAGEMQKLKLPRIGLWDQYGGSMPSGWIRWLLEQYEFPHEVVFPQGLDAGNLASRFDVVILPSRAVPERDSRDGAPEGGGDVFVARQPSPERLPDEFKGWLGRTSVARTVPQLKTFLEAGGTVLTIGDSTALARHLGLPVEDYLVERTPAGDRRLGRDKFYVPGSILRVSVDNSQPLAWGMGKEADVLYDNSPVMRLSPEATARGVKPVAWFSSAAPLRSGWAWGQHYLEDGVAVAEAEVGKGKLLLFGPEITFRAQPHGTFKFLFNGIYR